MRFKSCDNSDNISQDSDSRIIVLKASGSITPCENGPASIYTIMTLLKDTGFIMHKLTKSFNNNLVVTKPRL